MKLGLLPGTTSRVQYLCWLIEQLMAAEPDPRSKTDNNHDPLDMFRYTRL